MIRKSACNPLCRREGLAFKMQHFRGSGSLLVDQFIENFRVHLLSKHTFCVLLLHLKVILLTECQLHCPPGHFLLNKEICSNGWATCLFPFRVCQFTKPYDCCNSIIPYRESAPFSCSILLLWSRGNRCIIKELI